MERKNAPLPSARSGTEPVESGLAGRRSLVLALEEIRRTLHGRLDALETLARTRARNPNGETEDRLKQQVAELQRQCNQLRGEAERMRQAQHTSLEQLEHDRLLLAEAWDRLEQERLKCAQPHREERRKAAANPSAPQAPISSVAPSSDDPVIQAVLRQFQTLQRDVRRASNVE
jgi:hypothetical protein